MAKIIYNVVNMLTIEMVRISLGKSILSMKGASRMPPAITAIPWTPVAMPNLNESLSVISYIRIVCAGPDATPTNTELNKVYKFI